jgi:arginyl-tRNA synthetase
LLERSAVAAQEPASVARHAFQLAHAFNLFYHHDILTESDPAKKKFLLQLNRLVEIGLVVVLKLLGIESPEKM